MAIFQNRFDAGRQLARRLMEYADQPDVLVLALPRGGVPVGYEVARALHAPLDVFLVRKLGVPGHEELAFGAIASGGIEVVNPDVVRDAQLSEGVMRSVVNRERAELHRREAEYRGNRPEPVVKGKTIIVVDDGLATGASMYAAVTALKQKNPHAIVVAVPVAAPETCASLEPFVTRVVCAYTPQPFYGVGLWYEDFSQISDEEVRQLLANANQHVQISQEDM